MAVAHIVLHLTLCNAMVHAPSGTPIDVKLHATDHTGRRDLRPQVHVYARRQRDSDRRIRFAAWRVSHDVRCAKIQLRRRGI